MFSVLDVLDPSRSGKCILFLVITLYVYNITEGPIHEPRHNGANDIYVFNWVSLMKCSADDQQSGS